MSIRSRRAMAGLAAGMRGSFGGLATLVVALALLAGPPSRLSGSDAGADFEYFHALAMDAEGRTLFLGTHFGIFRSEAGGRSWKKVSLSTTHPHLDVLAIAPHPKDPLTIYIATHEAGIFRSTDRGTTWRGANAGLAGLDVHGLAIDPGNPLRLHAAVGGTGAGIYRSTDGGGSWARVDEGPREEIRALIAVRGQTDKTSLYAGTAEGVWRSAEDFRGWTRVPGLPVSGAVNGIGVGPDPRVIYVALGDGLFKSMDGGKSWKPLGQAFENLGAVAVNPRRPGEVYAILQDGALFRSADGGATWEPLRQDRPPMPGRESRGVHLGKRWMG